MADATALKSVPAFYQCNVPCRKQFTVTVGTLFERSHIPLTKWLMAAFLICASKKGMSALQLSRMLDISYKSTWFMMHRIREAMRDGQLGPIGGHGKVVEADETVGRRQGQEPRLQSLSRKSTWSCRWSNAVAKCARSISRTRPLERSPKRHVNLPIASPI